MNLLGARRARRRVVDGLKQYVELDLATADDTLREAVGLARASGSRQALGEALEARYQVLRQRRHFDESVPVLTELVLHYERDRGVDSDATHAWRNELILLLGRLGRYGEAEAAAGVRLSSQRRVHGDRSLAVAYGLCTLGWLLREQKRLDEAAGVYEEALSLLEQVRGPHHGDVGYALCGLAAVEMRRGNFDAAEAMLLRAHGNWDKTGHPELASAVREALTDLYVIAERLSDALALSERRFGHFVRLSPAESRDRERKLWNLERHSFLLRAGGRGDEADRYERRAALLRQSIAAEPSAADGASLADDPAGPVFEAEPFFGWVSPGAPPGRGC